MIDIQWAYAAASDTFYVQEAISIWSAGKTILGYTATVVLIKFCLTPTESIGTRLNAGMSESGAIRSYASSRDPSSQAQLVDDIDARPRLWY